MTFQTTATKTGGICTAAFWYFFFTSSFCVLFATTNTTTTTITITTILILIFITITIAIINTFPMHWIRKPSAICKRLKALSSKRRQNRWCVFRTYITVIWFCKVCKETHAEPLDTFSMHVSNLNRPVQNWKQESSENSCCWFKNRLSILRDLKGGSCKGSIGDVESSLSTPLAMPVLLTCRHSGSIPAWPSRTCIVCCSQHTRTRPGGTAFHRRYTHLHHNHYGREVNVVLFFFFFNSHPRCKCHHDHHHDMLCRSASSLLSLSYYVNIFDCYHGWILDWRN